ncbi:MAG TPA: dTDP-4-dehydrorhamnose reductase [Caulobacteraceae bacterium]|nr:dTDP-4-dehydrorhamnose reductase [Caulobacteraceae bacterium]
MSSSIDRPPSAVHQQRERETQVRGRTQGELGADQRQGWTIGLPVWFTGWSAWSGISMKVLVTGAGGQLANELEGRAPLDGDVVSLTEQELDICDEAAVVAVVARHQPEWIFNAAAYTAVDRAESEAEIAYRVNRDGAAILARAATQTGAKFVHVSTDFVFDGQTTRAYQPEDPTAPLGVYGASKLAGEKAVIAAAPDALIVRTAWVYSPWGGNFLKTMLRLFAERGEVRVVADQIGTPTSASTLADALWGLAKVGASGVFNCTDAGVASWYDFAQAIAEEAFALGLVGAQTRVLPIATSDYPTPAQRPAFSVLDKSRTWALLGSPAPHWRVAMRDVLVRLKALA